LEKPSQTWEKVMQTASGQPPADPLLQIARQHHLQIYFNHFVNNIGPGDITTLLLRNGDPVGVLNMSATTAKTLAAFLSDAVKELEGYLGHEIVLGPAIVEKMMAAEGSTVTSGGENHD
jgi:hypothetical protein